MTVQATRLYLLDTNFQPIRHPFECKVLAYPPFRAVCEGNPLRRRQTSSVLHRVTPERGLRRTKPAGPVIRRFVDDRFFWSSRIACDDGQPTHHPFHRSNAKVLVVGCIEESNGVWRLEKSRSLGGGKVWEEKDVGLGGRLAL